jgi:hypothetical protein
MLNGIPASMTPPRFNWANDRGGKGPLAAPVLPVPISRYGDIEKQYLAATGGAPAPGSSPTSAPKAPPSKPRGGFHYPSVRKRDDLGGLMGSD